MGKNIGLFFIAWWAANDARREGGHVMPITEIETENLRSPLPLLNEEKDNDRMVKAEALRELGMFEAAEVLLAKRFEEGLL